MRARYRIIVTLPILGSALFAVGVGQNRTDVVSRNAAQREAMKVLAALDGTWRGPAWSVLPSGEKHEITQTERVGPFLDGGVKVIEGRGFEADGQVSFNALGIVSFDPEKHTYSLRSYAQGNSGDFAFKPTSDGFEWEMTVGPAQIRYAAVIKDGTWREVGERIVPGKEPMRIFEMNLKRLADTEWPAGGAVGPK